MRLNLGEIALCLGCDSGQVIWQNDGQEHGEPESGGQSIVPLKKIAPGGLGKQQECEWSYAPWAGMVPTGGHFDSREIRQGNLFFCLPGSRTDGHDFAMAAARSGAAAIIALRNPFEEMSTSMREEAGSLPPVFLVPDVRDALWRVAACHRDTSIARVIGLTGTAGKTSVKEVLAQVLAMRGFTAKNPKNFNNQLGLPVSILNASADASFWVMEAGISEAHDMDELGRILRPDIALILNVGEGHVAGLGERGVAANKALLLDYVQPGGLVVVSKDYPDLCRELTLRQPDFERRAVSVVGFSVMHPEVDVKAAYVGQAMNSQAGIYEVFAQGRRQEFETPFRGEFGSENVAAIYAVANKLGLTNDEIASGFASARLPEQRFFAYHVGAFWLVDDSYNANPLSMSRMIEAARVMADEAELPLVLVLGEMLELGDNAPVAHKELGRIAAEANPMCVFWKGGHKEDVKKGLVQGNYRKEFYPVGGGQDFSLLLEELELEQGLVLFKGSRGNQIERLVDIFRDAVTSAGEHHAI